MTDTTNDTSNGRSTAGRPRGERGAPTRGNQGAG